MLDSVKNLYKAEDLTGENLLRPLKNYQRAFGKKIDQSDGIKKIVWKTGKIASAVLAYPVLGFLAGVGMVVKLIGVPSVATNNAKAKAHIKTMRTGILYTAGFHDEYLHSVISDSLQMKAICEYKVTKQNADALCTALEKQVDSLTRQFQKVYLKSYGDIINGQGEIDVILRINQHV